MTSIPSGDIIHDHPPGRNSPGERDGSCIYCESPQLFLVTLRVTNGLHRNLEVLPDGGGVACQKEPDRVKPWVYLGTGLGGVAHYGPKV
jgi:hypothetical protein